MELIPRQTNIDFMRFRCIAALISLTLISFSLYLWFSKGDSKYGVDYRGGHEVVVKIGGEAEADNIRSALTKDGFEDAIVQSFEQGSSQYSIRVGDLPGLGDTKAVRDKIEAVLKAAFSDQVEILKTDYVGPTIGAELRVRGLIAVSVGLLAMLLYITFRFELAFGIGAVVAVFHDVIISTGGYLLAGHTLNGASLAAALTIVGYSVYDTVVIFDRVREEILRHRDFELAQLLNEAVNAMLSRTIITHMLTFFSVLALLLFGGGAISDLSLFLVVGVLSGSYSTIFIASPVALAWNTFRNRSQAKVALAS